MTEHIRLYPLVEAAGQLGVSRQTLYRLIDRGELVPVQLPGGERRITGLELERYVAEAQQAARASVADKVRFLRERFAPTPRSGRSATASRTKKASR